MADFTNMEENMTEDEFLSEEGTADTDFIFTVEQVPQCADCPYNQGAVACTIFGEKPTVYMMNAEPCPKKK